MKTQQSTQFTFFLDEQLRNREILIDTGDARFIAVHEDPEGAASLVNLTDTSSEVHTVLHVADSALSNLSFSLDGTTFSSLEGIRVTKGASSFQLLFSYDRDRGLTYKVEQTKPHKDKKGISDTSRDRFTLLPAFAELCMTDFLPPVKSISVLELFSLSRGFTLKQLKYLPDRAAFYESINLEQLYKMYWTLVLSKEPPKRILPSQGVEQFIKFTLRLYGNLQKQVPENDLAQIGLRVISELAAIRQSLVENVCKFEFALLTEFHPEFMVGTNLNLDEVGAFFHEQTIKQLAEQLFPFLNPSIQGHGRASAVAIKFPNVPSGTEIFIEDRLNNSTFEIRFNPRGENIIIQTLKDGSSKVIPFLKFRNLKPLQLFFTDSSNPAKRMIYIDPNIDLHADPSAIEFKFINNKIIGRVVSRAWLDFEKCRLKLESDLKTHFIPPLMNRFLGKTLDNQKITDDNFSNGLKQFILTLHRKAATEFTKLSIYECYRLFLLTLFPNSFDERRIDPMTFVEFVNFLCTIPPKDQIPSWTSTLEILSKLAKDKHPSDNKIWLQVYTDYAKNNFGFHFWTYLTQTYGTTPNDNTTTPNVHSVPIDWRNSN